MTNLFDLTGKLALVPGASHGLGKAGARLNINGKTPAKMEALPLRTTARKALTYRVFCLM